MVIMRFGSGLYCLYLNEDICYARAVSFCLSPLLSDLSFIFLLTSSSSSSSFNFLSLASIAFKCSFFPSLIRVYQLISGKTE